jgi:uncharacterized protein GlcG (DUF336 family)
VNVRFSLAAGTVACASCFAPLAHADSADDNSLGCGGLPTWSQLHAAMVLATGSPPSGNGGFDLQMWGTVVNRDGVVCAVVFTGTDRGAQWPGSRVISAQKANTANAFSLPGLALSTANLYSAVQPGGSLYGLQHSNPVDPDVAYRGLGVYYGQPNDPMVGGKIGGVTVFGGGVALYDKRRGLIGAIGNVAWRARHQLALDFVPAGISGDALRPDNIVYDITSQPGQMPGVSASGWGHPLCAAAEVGIAGGLPTTGK